MTEKEIKHRIRLACMSMADELRGQRVVLFGSRAAGKGRPRSDFDIGVIGDAPLPLKTFYRIEDLFDDIDTLHSIDWVDLNRVSPTFRTQALKNIEVIYG